MHACSFKLVVPQPIHANGPREALTKLCTLPLLAGRNIDSSFIVPTVAACVDIVVHLELAASGRRRVATVGAVTGVGPSGTIDVADIFRSRGDMLRPTGADPGRPHRFAAAGLDPTALLGERG